MCTISVIIPTYKHSNYILESLESVFRQTYDDYEIIVINDGSPDDTENVLLPLIEAGKIRYFKQDNQGQAVARNRGLKEANGEYIAFLDDDDLWPSDKLEWQVRAMIEDAELVAVGGTLEVIDNLGRITGEMVLDDYTISYESLFEGNPFWSPGQTLIRTNMLRKVGGLNESIWGADDYDLWFRIASQGKFLYRSQMALRYRLHAANASKKEGEMLSNILKVIEIHLGNIPLQHRSEAQKQSFRWIYGGIGKSLARQIKTSLKHWKKFRFQTFVHFIVFVKPALKDPVLLKLIAKDLVPASAFRLIGAFKRGRA